MRIRPKQPFVPADRADTLRHEIAAVLSEESLSAREISERVGIQEKEVLEHLEHIKLARHAGLVMEPALCMACGFSFKKRERLKGPGRCPVCRSEHIAEPRFSLR
jgi:hypothetical protein